MRTLLNKIRKLLKDKRTRRLWSRTISVVAALVVFVTTYALVLPAITMERQAYCGLEAHQHTDECFERRLICTIPESPGHHHDDSCYTMRQEYSCTLEEHVHEEWCYDEEGNLICKIPEHTHEEGTCWQEVPELTCTLEESDGHQHGDACYENVLVCGKEVHTHSEACYENPDELLETAAVATTQDGAYGISSDEGFDGAGTDGSADPDGSGDEIGWTDSDDYGNAARSDAALSDDPSTGLTDSDNAANSINAAGSDAAELDAAGADAMSEEAQQDLTSGGISEEEDRYVPQLDPLAFDTALNKHTGIYYYHVREGETVEDSSLITEWKKVEKNTELGPNDLLRVYLSYTIPAGSLNETNPTAVYRLPASLHLTDDQVNGINAIENGIAAAYIDYNTLTVTDPDNYHRYLGAEAVEGTRTPDQTLADYLAQNAGGSGGNDSSGTGNGNAAGQEFISATVRVQNVYDKEGLYGEKGAYLGQDLIFTFSPYTIEKNQHSYDASGQPTRAGEKVRGWFAIDFNLTQVDLDEPYIEEVENIENIERIETEKNRGNENAGENTGDENTAVSDDGGDTTVLVSREFRTAKIVFVEKDTSRNLDEISASIKVVTAENYERVEANPDDAENIENVENSEDNDEDNGEEQPEENAEGIEEDLTGQEAETGEDAEGADSEDKTDKDTEEKKDEDQTGSQDDTPEKTIMPAMSFEDSIRVRTGKPAGVEDGSAGSAAASAAEALPKKAKVTVRVEADEGTFPVGTTMVLSAVEDLDAVAETVKETVENGGAGDAAQTAGNKSNEVNTPAENNSDTDTTFAGSTENKNPKTYGFQAVDISFRDADGNEIEPAKPVRVALSSEIVEQIKADKEANENTSIADPVVVHLDDDGNAEKMDLIAPEEIQPAQGKTEEELREEMEKAQTEAEKAASEEKEKATAEQEEKDWDDADSQTSAPDQAAGDDPENNATEGRNEKRAPEETNNQDQSAVEVSEKVDENQNRNQENTITDDQPTAGEDTANAPSEEPTVFFDTDSFSVYAIVYTVDFHYEVNGKEYEFSLPGGGFVSFTDLVEVLGIIGDTNSDNNGDENGPEIADNAGENAASEGAEENGVNSDANMLLTLGDVEVSEATRKFVADVASVEFSDPELVWIKKVNTETTVGELKQANKIVCQYSAELTKEQINEINAQSVRAGDWALISMFPFTSEETLTITMKDGKQYVVKVTDAQISTNVLTADGMTFCITVTYDDSAEIPVGTRLVAEEIDQKSVEFIQRVSETLAEVNNGYFKEQELLKKGEDSDTIEHVQPVSMDQARFFHVSLMYEGKEIEPKTPVQVDIKYVDGLGVEGIAERIPGVSHFTDDTVEVIGEVTTETDKEGRIIEFEYTQDSFSDIGTFIGHEGHDRLMKASAPGVNLRGSGTDETSTIEDFIDENGAPEASKVLNDNGDGTYTLALHVNPQSSEYTITNKSNVLFIMDRSSSMLRNSSRSYVEFGSEQEAIEALGNNEIVYGLYNNSYIVLSYMVTDFGGMWTSAETNQYDPSNGLYYGASGSRLSQEQAALDQLIRQLMMKNEGEGNEENIEISVISFATYAGKDQVYTYVGSEDSDDWGGNSTHQNDPNYRWGETEADWTGGTDPTALVDAVNDSSVARGTNWEEALKYAKVVMDGKKAEETAAGHNDEKYYVVFLTDGAPTATSWSMTQRPQEYEWGAYYGNGVNHPDGSPAYQNDAGFPIAYGEAKDDAKALVDAGYQLYNIFTYGVSKDYDFMKRLTNFSYSGGNNDTTELVEAYKEYCEYATNTAELVEYFNKIFAVITTKGNIGHSQVKIKDGLTQGAMTSTFVNGKPSAVHYTVTPGQGSSMLPYTVQVTMPEEGTEPIVTFTINGQNYTTTSGAVQKKVNPADAYDAGEYYFVKVGNVEYKMALASVEGPGEHEGELTWDLTPMGILWDDCDYKAEFVVWPKQEAYNYVAGLNNQMPDFEWDQETANEHEHIDSQGRKYWSHGVDGLSSIVKYEDGTFAVLTNTHQEVEYSIAKVEDGELKYKTNPTDEPLDFPDPMPLNATKTNLEKQWNVDRNPAIMAQYLYNPDGSPTKFVAEFDISSDNDTNPFATVSLGWDKDLEQYVWEDSSVRRVVYNGHVYYIGTRWSDEINIATGLMVTGDRLQALGLNPKDYPKAQYGETIYYILERGHDYHVKESTEDEGTGGEGTGGEGTGGEGTGGEGTGDEGTEGESTEGEGTAKKGLGYEFDFESPVFHPMLVNGQMMNIIFENEMNEETLSLTNPYPIDKMIPAPMNSIGSLVVENTLRGYINVEKIVVDKDGKTKLPDDTTQFSYDVDLENTVLDPAPFTVDDNNVPWYGINGLFYHETIDGEYYYYEAVPLGGNRLSLLTESGETVIAETEGDPFDKDVKGPTRIRKVLNEEEGEYGNWFDLYGNEMVHDSDSHVYDTIQIRQGQTLNIANVPKGTIYTITESILDPDYDLMSIVWGIKDGDETITSGQVEDISSGSITGTVVTNRDNHITFTNKIHSADLKVKKVDEDGKGLIGAQFTLTKTIVDPETEAQTWTLPEPGTTDTGIYTFADLPDGIYTLTETPPPNYTGVDSITFVVANGVIYMPGDTLPDGVTMPSGAVLPGDVVWTNNNNKTFALKIPNEHIEPDDDEIRVEKRWVDQNNETAEGTRDVKVQLRRYKTLRNHNVKVYFHADGYNWGGWHDAVNFNTNDLQFGGRTLTLTYTEQNTDYGNESVVVRKRSTQSVIASSGYSVNRSNRVVTITVPNVDDDIDITVSYNSGNYQIGRDRNQILASVNASPAGNTNQETSVDEEFSSEITTLSSPGYFDVWKIGNGDEFDFPLSDGSGTYTYYLVELDQNDQPIQEGQGGLVSITNNNGITTGIITATNKIDGSLTLKKQLGSLPSDDVSHAAGKYNFTVTGPGEPGTTKYVQIRIDAAGTVTYKVSNQEISFDETVGFVNAPSDGTVLIPNLVAGKYKVTEGEYRLDDQDGKYSTSLGKIEVESGTADISTGSATLNVRAENTPSAAATFTNMLVPMVEVPVVKNWQWSDDDESRVASWTATLNLEYREVLVDGEAASDAQHSWAPVYDTDGTTQKSVTIRSEDDPKEKFTNLPLYKTHDNGSIYRLIYAVDEVAYTINWNDGSPSTTWSKNESGHLSEHYSPDYEQDAGESEQPENQEDWDEWYTIRLKNVKSTREIEKTIDLSLEKVWEDEALQSDPDSKATFQLRRTYHEEYLDYDKDGRDLSNKPEVTVTLDLGNGLTKQLVVPKTAPVYISAVVKPGEIINLRFNKEGSTIALTGGDSNSTGQQYITTADPFEADDITVSLASGNISALMGGLDGIGLASFDPGETTEEQADEAFNHPMSEDGQSAGQKFTLDAEHGWQREWAGLPQVVEELSVTDSGTRMKTIVYSYYLVEIEEECYPKNYEVSFRNGQGDEVNPLISSGSVVAENKLVTTELSGTKTWSLDEETSYVLGTPILKLSRRTETTTVDDSGNPVTILSEPEDVTVSWEGEEQFLQPTWHSDGGFTRSFTYTDLPKTDKDGNTYVYSVEEVEFTVGAGENAVVYTAVRQPDGSYIVTPDKEGAKMFVVTQTGNDISNELHNTTIEIVKIDESTRGAANPVRLANAWFRLLMYNGNNYVGYDGIYGAVDGVSVGGSGEEQGKLAFENLPDGEYKIVETKTPDGYIKETDNSIYFRIKGGTVTRYDGPVSNDESVERNPIPAKVTIDGAERDNVILSISFEPDNNTFTVGNTPGPALPYTGGPGTRLFTILGSILILGAGVLLWRRRRLI